MHHVKLYMRFEPPTRNYLPSALKAPNIITYLKYIRRRSMLLRVASSQNANCISSEYFNSCNAGEQANLSIGGGPHMRISVSGPGAGMCAETI